MRTTLNLNDTLVRAAKKRAAESGGTLTSFIEDALRDRLAAAGQKREHIRLRPCQPSVPGLRPGVDLGSIARTLDLLDEDDDPH